MTNFFIVTYVISSILMDVVDLVYLASFSFWTVMIYLSITSEDI